MDARKAKHYPARSRSPHQAILMHLLQSSAFVLALCVPSIAQEAAESPIADAVARADRAVQAICDVPAGEHTFENTVGAMDALVARFFAEVRPIAFMKDVSPDETVRERGEQASKEFGEWFIDFGRHEGLYAAVKAYAETDPVLSGERQRLLEYTLRDFRREGMALSAEQRAELTEIDKELNDLGLEFNKNIAADESHVMLTREELAGCPDDFIDSLEEMGGVYFLRMKGPYITPIFNLCEVPSTRRKVGLCYARRAQENVAVLERILVLRARKAKLLGYPTIAHYVTETRMSKDPETVMAFYEDLTPKLRKKALIDLEELTEAKREATGDPQAEFKPWDFSFYKNYLMREKYAVDSEEVRQYFPMPRVTDGLFSITQSIYGVRYEDITGQGAERAGMACWHEDVKLFEVTDQASGDVLGHFFIDLHPRDGKYTHAAQFPIRLRRVFPDGTVMKPLVALVCNFSKPTGDKPALMTKDEVETYFHEFGHCLHSIFTEVTFANFSGTQVARDFVEAPSQMFEEWTWDTDVLSTFAAHYETGEPLPKEMIDGMLAARHLASGLSAEGQVFLGKMDMAFHTDPDGVVDTTAMREKIYGETRLFEPVPGLWSQASFGHLMGYQAGYYGYLWSLVFAADISATFKSEGMLSPAAGMRYRKAVLAKGGTQDEMDMLREYLGRDPQPDAFLEHLGLTKE